MEYRIQKTETTQPFESNSFCMFQTELRIQTIEQISEHLTYFFMPPTLQEKIKDF